jgi:hypothetical protein
MFVMVVPGSRMISAPEALCSSAWPHPGYTRGRSPGSEDHKMKDIFKPSRIAQAKFVLETTI